MILPGFPIGGGGTAKLVPDTRLIVSGEGVNNTLLVYEMTTPKDLSTATLVKTSPTDRVYRFSGDGLKAVEFFTNSTTKDVRTYDVPDPWDVDGRSTISFANLTDSGGAGDISPDGVHLYTHEDLTGFIEDNDLTYWRLSTPWNLDTRSLIHRRTIDWFRDVRIKPDDGSRIYTADQNSDSIIQYNLSTPWDITNWSSAGSFDVSARGSQAASFEFSSDGTKMYIGEESTELIDQYSLSTPWDVTTASYDGVSMFVGDPFTGALTMNR